MAASNVEPFKGRLDSLVQAMHDVRERNALPQQFGPAIELEHRQNEAMRHLEPQPEGRMAALERRILRLELELSAMKEAKP